MIGLAIITIIVMILIAILSTGENREWLVEETKNIFNSVVSIPKNIKNRYKVVISFEYHQIGDVQPDPMTVDVRTHEIRYINRIIPILVNNEVNRAYEIIGIEVHPDKDSVERFNRAKGLLK